jgi:hypothetical protein
MLDTQSTSVAHGYGCDFWGPITNLKLEDTSFCSRNRNLLLETFPVHIGAEKTQTELEMRYSI